MNKETIYSEGYASYNIRKLRDSLNLSQVEFANYLGINRSKIKRCESKDSTVTLEVALKIREIFKVSLSDLFSKPNECSN